ncbi:hypothetical protein CPB83DRAFT_909937 [Crepidotus variabilis]|uniref:Uncharacterized protein n=1 Tax=Crepidotus variabilis TaxID=179855 RepID=A0A9P6E8Q0_9AGAR|nr:hypothetical protein CPB83DRAFT_909937 [Crepidotus variabilis]
MNRSPQEGLYHPEERVEASRVFPSLSKSRQWQDNTSSRRLSAPMGRSTSTFPAIETAGYISSARSRVPLFLRPTQSPAPEKLTEHQRHVDDKRAVLEASNTFETHYGLKEHAYMRENPSITTSPVAPSSSSEEPETPRRVGHNPASTSTSVNPSTGFVVPRDDPADKSTGVLIMKENFHLKTENEKLTNLYASTSKDLTDTRKKHDVASDGLQNARAEIDELRRALSSDRELLAATRAELVEVRKSNDKNAEERGRLQVDLTVTQVEAEKLKERFSEVQAKVKRISTDTAGFGEILVELKQGHRTHHENLQAMKLENADIRKHTQNGLDALNLLLDEDATMNRAATTKDALQDLQRALHDSEQVTDMLRDKLLRQGGQLSEAQSRILELEQEKHGVLRELLSAKDIEAERHVSLSAIEENVEKLTERLATRERETFDLLAQSTSLKESLKVVSAELENRKDAFNDLQAKLEQCVGLLNETYPPAHSPSSQNTIRTSLEKEVLIIKSKFESAETSNEKLSGLLTEQSDVRNTLEREVGTFKSDLESAKESKEELRVLLADVKRDLATKEGELRKRDPNIDLEHTIHDLTKEISLMTLTLKEAKAKEADLTKAFHRSESLVSELRSLNTKLREDLEQTKEKLDSQRQLQKDLEKLAKEVASSKANADENLAKYSTSEGKSQRLQEENCELKERLQVQSTALFQSKEECAVFKGRVSGQERLLEAAQKNSQFFEDSIANLNNRLGSTEAKAEDLESRNAKLHQELEVANQLATDTSNSSKLEEQVQRLEAEVAKLVSDKKDLVDRATTLPERYKRKDLSPAEKVLVKAILSQAQAAHEQNLVEKTNELRAKQLALERVKAELTDSQATVRRMCQEKAALGQGANWLPSSPHLDLRLSVTNDTQPTSAALGIQTSVTLGERPPTKETSFAKMDADDLSDITNLSDEENTNKNNLKRSRSPANPLGDVTGKRRNVPRKASASKSASISAPPAAATSPAVRKKPAGPQTATKPKQKKPRHY